MQHPDRVQCACMAVAWHGVCVCGGGAHAPGNHITSQHTHHHTAYFHPPSVQHTASLPSVQRPAYPHQYNVLQPSHLCSSTHMICAGLRQLSPFFTNTSSRAHGLVPLVPLVPPPPPIPPGLARNLVGSLAYVLDGLVGERKAGLLLLLACAAATAAVLARRTCMGMSIENQYAGVCLPSHHTAHAPHQHPVPHHIMHMTYTTCIVQPLLY